VVALGNGGGGTQQSEAIADRRGRRRSGR